MMLTMFKQVIEETECQCQCKKKSVVAKNNFLRRNSAGGFQDIFATEHALTGHSVEKRQTCMKIVTASPFLSNFNWFGILNAKPNLPT